MSGKRRAAETDSAAPASRPGRVRRVLKWLLVAFLTLALVGVLGFIVIYKSTDIPDPNAAFKAETSFIYYANGEDEVGQFATQNRTSIPLTRMPDTMRNAVIAAEDRTFWTNRGIDPKGILRAAFSNAQGNATQGASTITQQYVKVLYLTQERSLTRKAKEAILSLKIQRELSKRKILEGYLNTIYFGRGAYGVEAAAQAFFAKPATKLNLKQSAVLASVLNSPSNYDPANGREERRSLKERYSYVLDGMADAGNISESEAERAKRKLPRFPDQIDEDTYGGQKGHMLTLVRNELERLGFSDEEINGGGLRVTTTFTQKAMRAAEEGVKEAKPDGFGDKKLHIGTASVQPGTGAVRGFYGGQDYLDSQINWAATGGMGGSTFKAYAVPAALDYGFSLQDYFEGNSPYEFPGGLRVRNEGSGSDGLGNDYGSAVTLLNATEESINTAFVDVTAQMDDGAKKIYDMARKMGVPASEAAKEPEGIPSTTIDLAKDDTLISLGRARISPINIANSYATIAAGGEYNAPHVIQKVESADGKELYKHEKDPERAMSKDIAADTSYALENVVTSGTGASASSLGRPAAGKTGTATNDKDRVSSSWFVGFTPQLATSVMYVRGDGDNALDGWLPSYFGADYPTDTWTAVMDAALEGEPVEELADPAYVDKGIDSDEGEYVPEPTPTYTPPPTQEPSPTQRPSPTKEPSPSDIPSPTQEPSPTDLPTVDPTNIPTPQPPSSSAPPEPTDSPTIPTPSNSGGGNGGGNGGGRPSSAATDDGTADTDGWWGRMAGFFGIG